MHHAACGLAQVINDSGEVTFQCCRDLLFSKLLQNGFSFVLLQVFYNLYNQPCEVHDNLVTWRYK